MPHRIEKNDEPYLHWPGCPQSQNAREEILKIFTQFYWAMLGLCKETLLSLSSFLEGGWFGTEYADIIRCSTFTVNEAVSSSNVMERKKLTLSNSFVMRSAWFMNAYIHQLDGKQAVWAAKTYQGHCTLPPEWKKDLLVKKCDSPWWVEHWVWGLAVEQLASRPHADANLSIWSIVKSWAHDLCHKLSHY